MKKVYLIVFAILLSFSAFAQSFTLNQDVDWDKNDSNNWSLTNAWTTTNPNSGGSGKLIIPEGKKLTLYGEFKFDGVLEVYGTIVFYQNTNEGGVLTMTPTSTIKIAATGRLISDGPGKSDGTKNVLTIGSASISGGKITDAGVGPNELNQSSLEAGGCRVTGCNYTPLPVTLLYIKATAKNQSVEINWASAKAWDFSHYELERSENGKEFYQIAAIDAEENSNETVEYSYTDNAPLAGTSYYRLKAVDIDGKSEYKGIEMVKLGAETFEVYPNPSSAGYVAIKWSYGTEGAVASLKDNTGRTVRSARLNGQQGRIETADLPAGMYLLVVQGVGGIQKTQVMIR